ncbi:hypothetical protein [Acinetobacter colistiniresistens]|uniref:hypothetical protein n=1 Tax=Acinetobacter colistiniresistens TaxID=280145 RepID=UPI000DD006F5|nr:hypothetical protein [Acinetobacter colistiniresistens]
MQIKQQTQSIIITLSLTLTTAASANTIEQAFTTGHQPPPTGGHDELELIKIHVKTLPFK